VGSTPAARTSFMSKKNVNFQTEKTHDLSGENHHGFEKILMLEDEGDLTVMLKQYLESNGFRVTTVTNGVEGLKKIMLEDFDVIVCDMLMPNLPGDMFYIAVQKVKPHLCRRFIFMTGHKGDKKIDDFVRKVHGMMLWKPFQPHELLEAIKYVLKKSREG
jgi:DNA-binding response OmpR family regulator